MRALLCRILWRWLWNFTKLSAIFIASAAAYMGLLMQGLGPAALEVCALSGAISVGAFLLVTLTRQDKVFVASGQLGVLFMWSFDPSLLSIWLSVALSALALLALLLSLPTPRPSPDYTFG